MRRVASACVVPVVGLLVGWALPAHAQEGPLSGPDFAAHPDLRTTFWVPAENTKRHELAGQWDGGALTLDFSRTRFGSSKDDLGLESSDPWSRSYRADVHLTRELTPSLGVSLDATMTYATSGTRGGPLLTARSSSLSDEIGLGISSGDARLSLSRFHVGGWNLSSSQEITDGIANGQVPARTGFALEAGLAETGERRIALRFEAGRDAGTGRDNRALLTLTDRF
jgi:hypothetical protein